MVRLSSSILLFTTVIFIQICLNYSIDARVRITTKTADCVFAGTDAEVSIAICYFDERQQTFVNCSEFNRIDTYDWGLNRGHTNHYQWRNFDMANVEVWNAIKIRYRGTGLAPSWAPEQFVVDVNGCINTFNIQKVCGDNENSWISTDGDHRVGPAEHGYLHYLRS